jgi:hypothetical protein
VWFSSRISHLIENSEIRDKFLKERKKERKMKDWSSPRLNMTNLNLKREKEKEKEKEKEGGREGEREREREREKEREREREREPRERISRLEIREENT